MLKPRGYGVGTDPNAHGNKVEHDYATCIHCGFIGGVRPGIGQPLSVMIFRADNTHYFKEMGFCRKCMDYVCPKAACQTCNGSRFKAMEIEENQARKLIL